jgi:serine/threonine-protein kinase
MDQPDATKVQTHFPAASTLARTFAESQPEELARAFHRPNWSHDYELLEEIARGGMGVIHRARDRRFGRDIAMKIVRADQADADTVRRFLTEATITGRLEHPGVPPVHDLGTLDDGRPFLAMKLIRGRTLADGLKASAGADRGSFIDIFEKVCQTLAFAHRQGVIHRDLKPANVMVGEFADVQVMDWGLAKERHAADVPVAVPYSDTAARDMTQAGVVMGTPAFIPPEQARGETNGVDERSDVFGLGAILCFILTGKPPFDGGDALTTVKLAAAGDTAAALERLDGCGADAELVALAKRCLAANPADRPADAGAVAAAVVAYREGVAARLRAAEVARAREAEARMRRRVSSVLGAAVLGLIALTVGGVWWADQQEQKRRGEAAVRAAGTRSAVEAALSQADTAVRAGKVDEAEIVVRQAEQRGAELNDATLGEGIQELTADIRTTRDLDAAADARWALHKNRTDYAEEVARYQQAFDRAGYTVTAGDAARTGERVRASRVRDRLVAGLDEWLEIGPEQPGLTDVLAAADPDPFRNRVRAAIAKKDFQQVRELLNGVDGATLPPSFAATVGSVKIIPAEDAERLLRPAYERHRDNFALALSLGAATLRPHGLTGDMDEPLSYFRAAVALRPSNVRARLMLTLVHSTRGRHDEAIAEARATVALAPDTVRVRNALGNAYYQARRYAEAEATFRDAIARSPDPQQLSDAYTGIAGVRFELSDYAGAAAWYRKALELFPAHASTISYLGDALEADGQLDAALAEYRRAVAAAADETYPRYALALALHGRRQYADAEAAMDRVLASKLVVLEETYLLASQIALERGDVPRARGIVERQLALTPAHSPFRDAAAAAVDRVTAYEKLATMPEAERSRLAKRTDNQNLSNLFMLGEVYRFLGRFPEAAACYRLWIRQADRFGIPLLSGTLLSASRSACRAAPGRSPADHRWAMDLLWRLTERIAEDHTTSTGHARLKARKLALFLAVDPDYRGVRDAAELAKLPAHERALWERVWARARAVAERSDNSPRETAPPARAAN